MFLISLDRGPPADFFLPAMILTIPAPDLFCRDTLQPLLLKGELSRKFPPDAVNLWFMTTLKKRAEGFGPSHLGRELHIHKTTNCLGEHLPRNERRVHPHRRAAE